MGSTAVHLSSYCRIMQSEDLSTMGSVPAGVLRIDESRAPNPLLGVLWMGKIYKHNQCDVNRNKNKRKEELNVRPGGKNMKGNFLM